MLFVGHTRFSLFEPDSGAWHASKGTRFKTSDEYQAHLFSDERLAPRTEILINESLPQLEIASRNHVLRHVISYSDTLPTKYEDALVAAADRFPFVVLDRRVNGKAATWPDLVAVESVAQLEIENGMFGRYRLDDDDLLPATYFDQVSPYVTPEHVGWIVSLGTGYTGIRIGDGYFDLRKAYQPLLALGLLSICRVEVDGKISAPASAPHHLTDRANPVILDSRGIGYFWGRHPFQDTAIGRGAKARTEVINRLRDTISMYPAVPEDEDVSASFPTIAHRMHRAAGPESHSGQESPTENILTEPLLLNHEPTKFKLPAPTRRFALAIDLECAGSLKQNNALASFLLTNRDGEPLGEDMDQELLRAGLVRSVNPEIGFYRYLPTTEGARSINYDFELPPGVKCRGISFRLFGTSGNQIRITKLAVFIP